MRYIFNSKSDRKHIAEKYDLDDSCEIVRIFLTSTQREELLEHIFYTDAKEFTSIARSVYFYLIKNSDLSFELFCSEQRPKGTIHLNMLNSNSFIQVKIEEKYLLKFLSIITPLKVVELNEA